MANNTHEKEAMMVAIDKMQEAWRDDSLSTEVAAAFCEGWQARAEYEKGDAEICETAKAMPMIDENFVKEKINPIVGYLFHSGWRLGNRPPAPQPS